MPKVFDIILYARTHGGIAQLVERLLCKQDVSGSSPLISTNRIKECSPTVKTPPCYEATAKRL